MPCERVRMPGGGVAIVCSRAPRRRRCVGCGELTADARLCDARLKSRPGKTCDAVVCPACTTSPAPDKDLCPDHARAWRALQAKRLTDSP